MLRRGTQNSSTCLIDRKAAKSSFYDPFSAFTTAFAVALNRTRACPLATSGQQSGIAASHRHSAKSPPRSLQPNTRPPARIRIFRSAGMCGLGARELPRNTTLFQCVTITDGVACSPDFYASPKLLCNSR
ncbi:MAG UNVERIFIED_CONTAM: hypothetical protein LVR18_04695 [Planctomycetaceae bacterium]